MLRRLTASLALLLVVGKHLAAQSQASPDLWSGTRHLAIAKSTFVAGPAPKERIFVIDATDKGIKATVSGTQADGTSLTFSYTAKFDGKFYPVTGRGPADSVSFRRVNTQRLETTQKTGTKVQATSILTLSRDGRVVTLTFKGPHDEPSNVLVFEK
jgi:hypothetical protein